MGKALSLMLFELPLFSGQFVKLFTADIPSPLWGRFAMKNKPINVS
jgi:hypothetical protein